MHPLQLDKCFSFLDKFREAHPEVTLDTKIVRVMHGDVLHPDYTKENIDKVLSYKQLLNTKPRQTVNKPFLGKSVTMKLTEPDAEPRLISCQEEILKGRSGYNDFNNWECYIGVESLMIDFDGKVYKGYCQMDGCIGTIPNFEVPKDPTICHYGEKRCTCNLDFATTKYSMPNKAFYFKQI
jgi:hypothetical protein